MPAAVAIFPFFRYTGIQQAGREEFAITVAQLETLIGQYGIWVVGIMIFLVYLGIPGYPGGICLFLVGALVHFHYLSFPTAFLVSLIAATAACCCTYWVCSLWNRPIQRFVDQRPSFRKKFDQAQEIIDQHGTKGLFLARMLPVVRAMISIPAGLLKMDFLPYVVYSALGSAIYIAVCIYIGSLFLGLVT